MDGILNCYQYLLQSLKAPPLTPGGQGLYRNCGCVLVDVPFVFSDFPIRVSRGVGRTNRIEQDRVSCNTKDSLFFL